MIAVCKINSYFSSKALAGRCPSWRGKSSPNEEMTKAYSANTQMVDLRHPVKMAEAIDNQRLSESSYRCCFTGLTMSDFCNHSSHIDKSSDCQSIDTLSNPVVHTNFTRDIDNQPSQEANLSPEFIRSTVIINPLHIPTPTAEALGNNKANINYRSVYRGIEEEWMEGSNKEFRMNSTSFDDLKPEGSKVCLKTIC